MSTPCSIEMYKEPLETLLSDLDGAVLDVFFAHLIVNPFGPTLTFVAAAGKPNIGQALPLVKVPTCGRAKAGLGGVNYLGRSASIILAGEARSL